MNEESAYADTDAEASERRHLPECPTITDPHGVSDIGWSCDCECQCEILRACEARVASVVSASLTQDGTFGDGYAAGVQAAREAVAAIQQYVHIPYESPSAVVNDERGDWLWRDHAIAAIDALKEKR